MDPRFRKKIVFSYVTVLLIIAAIAATAIIALRTTTTQLQQAREIDHRLMRIDRLRSDTRELALSARRFVLSGDLKQKQRVLAIVHAMRAERDQSLAQSEFADERLLAADIDEYVAALTSAMDADDNDPIVRFSRFEDALVKIRSPLTTTFDDIISRERGRRESLRSTQSIGRVAQWAVGIASLLGILLVITATTSVLRGSRRSASEHIARSRSELLAAATELRAPLEAIIADTAQLRLAVRELAPARVVEGIARNASRVNGMLAELLDVTAMQTGMTSLRREPFDAAELVDHVARANREAAHARGVRLSYDAQLSVTVFADRERIRHVLDSLLQVAISNAPGGAELVVHFASTSGEVRFAIIEAGARYDDAPRSEHNLALHLSSRVVEAHGGRLDVQTSAIGRTYWFTLPTEPSVLV